MQVRASSVFYASLSFALALAGGVAPASALLNRAWVSGHGLDAAGCGPSTNPCRTPQYVHNNIIADGGEIDIQDPAGYGSIIITKSVSIVNDGVGTAGFQPGGNGNAITVNAGMLQPVHLRGLNIDGLGTGNVGILFNTGQALDVVNCVVRHFAGPAGIDFESSSSNSHFTIVNSTVSDNKNTGILIHPNRTNVFGTIHNSIVSYNGNGIVADAMNILPPDESVFASVSKTSLFSNRTNGLSAAATAGTGPALFVVSDVSINGGDAGLALSANTSVRLSHSVIANTALTGVSFSGGGTVYSLGDNSIGGNTSSTNGTLTAETPF